MSHDLTLGFRFIFASGLLFHARVGSVLVRRDLVDRSELLLIWQNRVLAVACNLHLNRWASFLYVMEQRYVICEDETNITSRLGL